MTLTIGDNFYFNYYNGMSGPFIPIAWIASRFINTRTYKGMGQCDIEKEKKLEKG